MVKERNLEFAQIRLTQVSAEDWRGAARWPGARANSRGSGLARVLNKPKDESKYWRK